MNVMRLSNEGTDLTLSEIFFCRTPRRSQPVFVCSNTTAIPLCLRFCASRGGVALALPDEQILASLVDWARHEGIFPSPEGAAATAAYDHLLATGFLKSTDRVVLFNTGGGLKYTDVTAEAMGLQRPAPQA